MNENFPSRSVDTAQVSDLEKEAREVFMLQFEAPESIKIGNAMVEVFDFTPENLTEDTPIVFVPGYGKSGRAYKDILYDLYKSGRRVLAVTSPAENVSPDEQVKNPKNFPEAQLERARALLGVLTQKEISVTDVVTHSEGGMNAVIAADMNQAVFRHFVFIGLPGVTGKTSYPEILRRFIKNAKANLEERKTTDRERADRFDVSHDEIQAWVKRRGAIKASLESFNPGRVEIDSEVRRLNADGHGISIIANVDDVMLPMHEYQQKTAQELGVDGFYSVVGGHSESEINQDMSALVTHAITALCQKYEKIGD